MELNMKVLVKVAVMLFLLGITATVEARSDARSFIKEVVPNADANYYSVKSTITDDEGFCTLPWPVYTCNYPGKHCFAGCSGRCICQINELEATVNCKCVADETKLFLLGTTATVEARSDASSLTKEVVPSADAKHYSVKSTTTGFQCACTRPWPIYTCRCPGEACFAACNGTCFCEINEAAGTRNCKCKADETKLSPGAGAHQVK